MRELGDLGVAKLHELDPQAYLAEVLERIVSGRTKKPSAARAARLELEGGAPAHRTDRRMSPRRQKASSSMATAAMPLAELKR
ncbi:hypothetical protein GCM10007857_88940 [Bradyrhizobium iriomotense]|uniref:Transposase IS66 C-terminal domain-containing protein n=1 Tax=Bradyrhizobium iriomotense TaxID=441950 RepID=A0ABQ6BCP7_9BRAD|nr:hypothetical protein GCM10007857_88940 [Bradyrhizobium iriomotense]